MNSSVLWATISLIRIEEVASSAQQEVTAWMVLQKSAKRVTTVTESSQSMERKREDNINKVNFIIV